MEILQFFFGLISFFSTFYILRIWIKKALMNGIVGPDMNKPGKPLVAEMGGICVVFGFVFGLLLFIGAQTFIFKINDPITLEIFAVLCTVLLIAIIGMTDDLLGWKTGLPQWLKPLLAIPAAIPLMVINAGNTWMELPFIGEINWGIIYPLIIIPFAIMCASNGFNILAGYNGLEAGMGVIILTTLGALAYYTNKIEVAALAFCMVGALLAFLWFNWYPAKVFPGDSLTYPVGALIACIAILGDLEKIALILFIPYIIDFLLVLRSHCKGEAFAKVYDDGSLEQPFERITHMTHFALASLKRVKAKVFEKDVVYFLYGIELIFVIISILIVFR